MVTHRFDVRDRHGPVRPGRFNVDVVVARVLVGEHADPVRGLRGVLGDDVVECGTVRVVDDVEGGVDERVRGECRLRDPCPSWCGVDESCPVAV